MNNLTETEKQIAKEAGITDEEARQIVLHIRNLLAIKFAIDANERLKYTQFYHGELKMKGNLFIKILLPKEKFFDKFEEAVGENINETYNAIFDAAELFVRRPISDFERLKEILEADNLDSKSITGIAKKILKNKK